MQTVERKPEKRRRPWRLGLLAALGVLAAGLTVFLLLRGGENTIPEAENRRGVLLAREPGDIREVTLTFRDGESWSIRQEENGDVRLTGTAEEAEADWTANPQLTDPMLDALAHLSYEEVLTEDPSDYRDQLADFGLSPAKLTAAVRFADGTETVLRIGNEADEEGNVCYLLREEDPRLYAVSASTVRDLSVEKALLHPIPEPEIHAALLDRITVRDAEGKVTAEWALDGLITDQDAGVNWRITVPLTYPADEETIANLKKSAENLRLGAWAGTAAETLPETGSLTFHMAAGSMGKVSESGVYDVTDHEAREVTLVFRGQKNEMSDYVSFEGETYAISHFSVAVFTETEPLSTAARYPVLTPLDSLESMTVEEDGNLTAYTLNREGEEPVCLKNGEDFPYDAFAAAYARLLVVTVSGKLPEDAVYGKTHTKYAFCTVSGRTHTVELKDFDGLHDAVTVDGQTLFYLIKEGMRFTPDSQ